MMSRPVSRLSAAKIFVISFIGFLLIQLLVDFGSDQSAPQIQESTLNKPITPECQWSEDDIGWIECDDASKLVHSTPPYLLSFQGSGNTFTRLILELLTGFYTGSSLWKDRFLIQAGFEGDKYCDDRVLLLKSHVWCCSSHSLCYVRRHFFFQIHKSRYQ